MEGNPFKIVNKELLEVFLNIFFFAFNLTVVCWNLFWLWCLQQLDAILQFLLQSETFSFCCCSRREVQYIVQFRFASEPCHYEDNSLLILWFTGLLFLSSHPDTINGLIRVLTQTTVSILYIEMYRFLFVFFLCCLCVVSVILILSLISGSRHSPQWCSSPECKYVFLNIKQ